MGWDVVGVRGETRFVGSLYSIPTGVMIARFERDVEPSHRVQSLYVRRCDAHDYAKLFGPDEFTSAGDAVACHGAPFLYFLVRTRRPEAPTRGGWTSIARANLDSGEIDTCVDAAAWSLKYPQVCPGASRPWIERLLDVSADGARLLCVLAEGRAVLGDDGVLASVHYDRHVIWLDVATGDVERLTQLNNAFF